MAQDVSNRCSKIISKLTDGYQIFNEKITTYRKDKQNITGIT